MAPSRPRISDVSHTPTLSSSGVLRAANQDIPPFFNTTFSTHRVSPLFLGSEGLTPARLAQLAHRLRDILVGDVVRGIQIGLESTDTPVGQVGPLRAVKIRWFHASEVLGEDVDSSEPQLLELQDKGLWIEIRHENAVYVALLIPATTNPTPAPTHLGWQSQTAETPSSPDNDRFLHLPLMLMRMPLALKQVISSWLSDTFDCRVSKLALGTRTLVNVLEGWMRTSELSTKGPDLVVTLAFNAPLADKTDESDTNKGENAQSVVAGLRTMDITMSPLEVRRFTRAGTYASGESAVPWSGDSRERRTLAGGNTDDGWAWREDKVGPKQPFTDALARYLDHHLALNLFHPSVRIVQISCGGFVLGQSRLKIIRHGDRSGDLSRASWMFITQLGQRVVGDELPSVF
ncbi:kinetochore complex Sim4 subunit Fta1-domain-containing protein [Stachybotrys elegans]|uniref:Kinetochore complex Sim4 subunit Fta1-domain-containing protein n=1 Tax=Stachybotrys elegans TaxID=80388 RepID=A0A8K0SY40_9HYPO|nr:kinetochore complex Sim4 subunit Fta1-domain-containing protein [Stachybotrys elegans]